MLSDGFTSVTSVTSAWYCFKLVGLSSQQITSAHAASFGLAPQNPAFFAVTPYVRAVTNGMLRTGEAARRLGVSRQHVVELCNRGRLPYVTVGAHRRMPEQAVNARNRMHASGKPSSTQG